jgi:hypothetical protein
VLFDGVTLGALSQDVRHPAAGYLAFVTIGIFLVGVALLPARMAEHRLVAAGTPLPQRRV